MPELMRAIVLDGPGAPDALKIRDVPRPVATPGWVLLKVHAFGLNRSEFHFRRGLGSFGSFPRIPGIEATGVVVEAPGGEFDAGTQAAALMGGMGRTFDGGYAEYVLVPAANVVPFKSSLDWATLGAVPEMLQTANGSLAIGVNAPPGSSLLIRGGTSSIGLALAVLAKRQGMTVVSTTRSPAKTQTLLDAGVDHVVVDSGSIAEDVRAIFPEGVGGAVELVGSPTLKDTLRATAIHGTVCFTGMLSDEWTVKDFYPIDFIPNGVRLTAYSGEASDLPATVLQDFLEAVEAGQLTVPIGKTYAFDQIVQAHQDMEDGSVTGKLVVTVDGCIND
ncbi:zinc-binding alcohol dehydrogenase family protein [Paenarthrobacter ureafaciens]|uniref:zinc-binding alcohol dehydrogenase family protein n=1 Tax=Paenarthrobacter ureafaciens TaxID=37931 RepID=UPI002DB62E88|nr:zinc-binding alcohol dehydrogenase family protein [Paenarthrobacter ureafaciens]MEC3853629.1 zinc-binding alcohol dehydrogenase family protein [Paenarthrobacter ureafaciens]